MKIFPASVALLACCLTAGATQPADDQEKQIYVKGSQQDLFRASADQGFPLHKFAPVGLEESATLLEKRFQPTVKSIAGCKQGVPVSDEGLPNDGVEVRTAAPPPVVNLPFVYPLLTARDVDGLTYCNDWDMLAESYTISRALCVNFICALMYVLYFPAHLYTKKFTRRLVWRKHKFEQVIIFVDHRTTIENARVLRVAVSCNGKFEQFEDWNKTTGVPKTDSKTRFDKAPSGAVTIYIHYFAEFEDYKCTAIASNDDQEPGVFYRANLRSMFDYPYLDVLLNKRNFGGQDTLLYGKTYFKAVKAAGADKVGMDLKGPFPTLAEQQQGLGPLMERF